jgi:hypothetical protein
VLGEIGRALRRQHRVLAQLKLSAHDAAGNITTKTRTVKLAP